MPQAVAEVTGAIGKNAGRFKDRATPKVRSLGPAPKSLSDAERALWDEFNADFPWLGRSDRQLVRNAVILQAQIDDSRAEGVPVAALAQMRLYLSSMGGTPVDRTKVNAPDEKPEDPADEFVN